MAAANSQEIGCEKASTKENTIDSSKRELMKDSILPPTSIYTSSSSTIASKDDLITQPPKLSWPPPQAGAPASMPLPGMLPWFPVPPPIMHYLHSSGKSQIQCCQLLLSSGSISGSSFPHQLLPAPIPPPHPGLLPYQFSPIINSDWGRFSDPLLLSAPKI